MRDYRRLLADWLLITAGITAAGMVLCEGVSFAQHMPEIHARLLATGGIGLFCTTLMVGRLWGRIGKLERQLAAVQQQLLRQPPVASFN